jgi:hypothetical protein
MNQGEGVVKLTPFKKVRKKADKRELFASQ